MQDDLAQSRNSITPWSVMFCVRAAIEWLPREFDDHLPVKSSRIHQVQFNNHPISWSEKGVDVTIEIQHALDRIGVFGPVFSNLYKWI
jgi:hypothetical protein